MNEEHLKLEEEKRHIEEEKEDKIAVEQVRTNEVQSQEAVPHELNKEIKQIDGSRYVNEEFMKRTSHFREGTGDVEFIDLKLLDETDTETFSFAFNQTMKIRIVARVNEDAIFGIAYHIRDDKNMELLGSSTMRELGTLIEGKKGEYYQVDISTPLPIIEGNYNISLVASRPIIANRTAMFLCMIDNAAVFAVEENTKQKLWDKVYLKNDVQIEKIN